MPNCLGTSVPALFADDTNLSVSGATTCEIEEKLEIDLNNVHQWLLANKLTLNFEKFPEHMLVGSRERPSQIDSEPILSISSESIKRVSSSKTLGVIVDECITWKDHIDKLAKKVSKDIGMLRRSQRAARYNISEKYL